MPPQDGPAAEPLAAELQAQGDLRQVPQVLGP